MITEEKKKVLELFAEGRKFYKLKKFQEAREAFGRALQIDPKDGPSKVYLDRCSGYIENPPPEDWDGIKEMMTK